MTLANTNATSTSSLFAHYLAEAPALSTQAELYQRPIAPAGLNWTKHLPHPMWGSDLTRRRLEILTIALGSLGYSIAYDIQSADTTLQAWHVSKGAIAGTLYHNAADDRYYALGLPVIPALRCVNWL